MADENAKSSLENPISKIYLTLAEGNLYYYTNGDWIKLNEKYDDLISLDVTTKLNTISAEIDDLSQIEVELSSLYAPLNDFNNLSADLKNNYYTKSGTDEVIVSAINDLTTIYTSLIEFNDLKNDVLTGYLRESVISSDYTPISSYNDLSSNTYRKSEVYTKSEVETAINNANHIKKSIQQTLPTIADAEENTIYLIPNSQQLSQNVYDEYLLINNQFEIIGTTAIDITNYANLNHENTFLDDQIISGDLTIIDNLIIPSAFIATSGVITGDLSINSTSLSSTIDDVGELKEIDENGLLIITPETTTIIPKNNKVYKHTLAANDVITFTTLGLSSNYVSTFELHLTQPSTAVSFTFSNSIKWIDNLNFNSSNLPPDFSEGSKLYAIIFRWDGTELLANLAYTKDIE